MLPIALRRLARLATPVLPALVALAPLLIAGVAGAQSNNPVAPPEPGDLRGGPAVWIAYVSLIALTAAVLVVSLFPSKRGHQD